MEQVWILENSKLENKISFQLLGEFSVRLFGSFDSFKKVISFKEFSEPRCILVNLESLDAKKEMIEGELKFLFPNTTLIFLDKENHLQFNLMENLKEVLEKKVSSQSKNFRYKDLIFDPDRQTFAVESQDPSFLTQKETRILKILLENMGQCVSKNDLLNLVWNGNKVSDRTLDSHISRLRSRISQSSVVIETQYGNGYVLK